MSNSPIDRSPDLKALTEARYPPELRGAYLIVRNVPYQKNAAGRLATADMVTSIEFADDTATAPSDHTVWWTRKPPFRADGSSMERDLSCGAWEQGHDIGEGLTAYMRWSRKPVTNGKKRAYVDYEEKVTTYIAEVAGQAEIKHPGVLEAAKTGEACQRRRDYAPEQRRLSDIHSKRFHDLLAEYTTNHLGGPRTGQQARTELVFRFSNSEAAGTLVIV